MPGYLLHEDAEVLCKHPGGRASPMAVDPHVKVSGKSIVTQISPYKITDCSLKPQAGGPCATAMWTTAAKRVKASGKPVLLKDSAAVCAPTGTDLKVITTQTRVKGI